MARPSFGRLSLRTRLLLLQLGIVLLVVAAVCAAFVVILSQLVERQYAERVLGIAHAVAQNPAIRDAFDDRDPPATIQPLAESVRLATGVSFVVVWNKDRIRYSHPVPERIGQELSTDNSPALDGRAYTTVERGTLGTSVRAKVPIYKDGQLIGGVSVGVLQEQIAGLLRSYWPLISAVALAALAAGAVVSNLLSSHVKRQIFGLEPAEIAALVQQREALLHGIREGVLAIDRRGAITVANAEARRLLDLPEHVVGRPIAEVLPDSELPRVVETGQPVRDHLTLGHNGRAIVVNRMPVRLAGQVIGAVSTFRDQTEVQQLARELTGTRSHLDDLRAQAHEFANTLHTIAGLLELDMKDEAVELISRSTRDQQSLVEDLPRRIAEPALSALLVGKASVAAERGIDFVVTPGSRLGTALDQSTSGDLVTVLGNLVDNAFDATGGRPERRVRVAISDARDAIRIAVADTGPGVPRHLRTRIFDRGVTTKPDRAGEPTGNGHRGVGLALVRHAVTRLGGRIAVRSGSGGAAFLVHVPASSLFSQAPVRHPERSEGSVLPPSNAASKAGSVRPSPDRSDASAPPVVTVS